MLTNNVRKQLKKIKIFSIIICFTPKTKIDFVLKFPFFLNLCFAFENVLNVDLPNVSTRFTFLSKLDTVEKSRTSCIAPKKNHNKKHLILKSIHSLLRLESIMIYM